MLILVLKYSDKPLDLGKFGEYLEHHAKKLPQSVKTLSSNVFLTQDSPIYQGLQKATQYGDFIAKAVLYQPLLEKGVSEQNALIQVADAFVDYDKQRGRWRGGLEDFGLLWFWNYKLRIAKQALYLMKHHPLASLAYFASPIDSTIGSVLHVDIGSPLTDNVVFSLTKGNLATVGPGMYSNIITSNPWINLMY